jgi:hypothetical protein
VTEKNLAWFAEFEQLGYTVEQACSGHFKVRDSAGMLVTSISATPSDHRGHMNVRAQLRRHERHRSDSSPPRATA